MKRIFISILGLSLALCSCKKEEMNELNNKYIFVPNSFSPNGDGNNDILNLRIDGFDDSLGTQIAFTSDFRIYDGKEGILLFKSNNNSIGWDGRFNGKALPLGTYMYYLNVNFADGDHAILNGNISLVP